MKTTLAIFGVLFALCAKADYIYWMIDTESASAYNYTTALLRSSSDSNFSVTINDGIDELQSYTTGNLNDKIISYQADVGGFYSDIGSYSGQSFFVELLNGDQRLAQSPLVALTSANIYSGSVSTPASAPAHFGSYNVPEPTSGLLFLIGGMLLGLKRRRQQV